MLETIKSSTEISSLFNEGQRYTSPSVTLLVQKSDGTHGHSGRVAFIAGKKLGGAVWRNQARRRLREVCRSIGGPWAGYDVAFIAKGSLTRAEYSTVCTHCKKMISQAMSECN